MQVLPTAPPASCSTTSAPAAPKLSSRNARIPARRACTNPWRNGTWAPLNPRQQSVTSRVCSFVEVCTAEETQTSLQQSGSATSGTVNVVFSVPHLSSGYGETLRIVGDIDELGYGDAFGAPELHTEDHKIYQVAVKLPVRAFSFKVVVVVGDEVVAEPGAQRYVELDKGQQELGPRGYAHITCTLGNTKDMAVEYNVDRSLVKKKVTHAKSHIAALAERERVLQQRMMELRRMMEAKDDEVSQIASKLQNAEASALTSLQRYYDLDTELAAAVSAAVGLPVASGV